MNEVKLTFRIDDNGTLSVFDRAGQKLSEVGRQAEVAGQKLGATGGHVERAAGAFSRMQASVITANQAMSLFGQAVDIAERVVGGLARKIQEMDNIGETAKKVGLTARELSSLRLAAQQGGVSLEGVARSSQFLQRQIVAAQDATSKQAQLFRELHVDTSRGLLSTLAQLGKAFDQLPDGAEKTALAIALMGRSGTEELNVLNATLEESIKKNDALGLTMSDATASGASHAADAIDEMTGALGGLGEAIASKAAPYLTNLAGMIADVTNGARTYLTQSGPQSFTDPQSGWTFSANQMPRESLLPPNAGPQLPPNVGRIRSLLAGMDNPTGTAKAGGAKRNALKASTDAADKDLQDRQQAIVGLLESEVTLREEAVRRAEEQLRIAQESGASAAQQLALAQQIDDAERSKLETLKEQLQTQLMAVDLPPIPGDAGEVAKLQAELQIVNERLAEGGTKARALTSEFAKSNEIVLDMGSTLNNSLQRAVDGLLSGGGKFSFGNLIRDTLRAQVSSIIGGGIDAIFKGGTIKIDGLDKLEGAIGDLGKWVGGLFGGGSGGAGGAASLGSGGVSGAGGAGVAGVAAGLPALAAGGTAATIAYLGSKLISGLGNANKPLDNLTLASAPLKTNDLVKSSGLFSPGAIAAAVVVPIVGQFYAIIAGIIRAFIQAPTEGSQRAREVRDLLKSSRVPQQAAYVRNESGVRAQFLTNAPDAASAAAFGEAGFAFTKNLKQPTLEQLGNSSIRNSEQVRELRKELATAAAANPGVESMRTNEFLGFGVATTRSGRGGVLVANLLTNNFELLGASAEETRRQLLKMAQAAGVTLVSGLESLNQAYRKHRITEEQLASSAQGVVDIFTHDLPKSIRDQLPDIIKSYTSEKYGVDVAGVTGAVNRLQTVEDYKKQARDIRYGEMNPRQQERELRARLAKIDADLATTTDTADRERLLKERAQVGFDYVSLAQSRYGEGTAARRNAVNYGLQIVEDTNKALANFAPEISDSTDATKSQTQATKDSTQATTKLTGSINDLVGQLKNGVTSKLDIAFDGEADAIPAIIQQIKAELTRFLTSPEFRKAVREAEKGK